MSNDQDTPFYRKENVARQCCCGSRAPNTMDLDSFHISSTYWRERLDEGIPLRDYIGRDLHSTLVIGEDGVTDSGVCWEINCLTIHGGCGRSLTGDSPQETIDLWNKRGPLEGTVTLIQHERLKRRLSKRDKIIEGLKARIRHLELIRPKDAVSLQTVEKSMDNSVQRAFCNLRFLPVFGLGGNTKIANITLEDPKRGKDDQN